MSHKADPLDEHFSQVVTFVDQSDWRSRDIDADPQYLTPSEWLQMSFRHICKNLAGYRLLEVEVRIYQIWKFVLIPNDRATEIAFSGRLLNSCGQISRVISKMRTV